MNTITISAVAGKSRVLRVVPPTVHVDGHLRSDLLVEQWRVENGPDFGSVLLRHVEATGEQFARLPAIGQAVRVSTDAGSFDGMAVAHVSGMSDREDSLTLEVRHVLWQRLSRPVLGAWQMAGDKLVWARHARVTFNGRRGTASRKIMHPQQRSTRVFDRASDAVMWSVGDILNYLLRTHLPQGIAAPDIFELNRLAGSILPEQVDVTGRPLREALAAVAELAGLCIRAGVGAERPSLVVYRPGVEGRSRRVVLAERGQSLAESGSNLLAGQIRHQASGALRGRTAGLAGAGQSAVRSLTAVGARKRLEATLELKPGWNPALESSRHRDFVRSLSADWPAVADVFRKWVLNESGAYSEQPHNLPAYDCAELDSEAFYLSAGRPIGPCLSGDEFGASHGIVVEVSLRGGPWRRYAGTVLAAADECSIYLTDDSLPSDYFHGAREHDVKVRVTGTLTGDARLAVEAEELSAAPSRQVEFPFAGHDRVHRSSVFFRPAGGGILRDDTPVLMAWLLRVRAARANECESVLTLATVDESMHVGDCIAGIDGRDIPLGFRQRSRPSVDRVVHRFGQVWTTELRVIG